MKSLLPYPCLRGAVVGLAMALLSPSLLAADRALLIGVQQYADPANNLVGIDIDVDQMDAIAEKLGFQERKRLQNAQATVAGAERAIEEWLIRGTGPEDRALLYFSGHGSRIADTNGDEAQDHQDEVLVMHDAQAAGGTLRNVLVDDRLYELLQRIPARETYVLIDACHSGSATKQFKLPHAKSGSWEAQTKFLFYPGMPEQATGEVALKEPGDGGARYVGLSAASDEETAGASKKGSFFTRALVQAINEGARDSGKGRSKGKSKGPGGASSEVTLEWVQGRSGKLIDQIAAQEGSTTHHPQISGNKELARKPLLIRISNEGQGPEWNRFQEMANGAMGQLQVRASSTRLEEGDRLQLEVDIPDSRGYLNVVQVDAADNATLLFPNKLDRNPEVSAGRQQLPGDRPFNWVVRGPFGPTQLLIFFTREPLDLFESSNGERDREGKLLATFPALNAATARAIMMAPSLYSASLVVNTCETLNQCR